MPALPEPYRRLAVDLRGFGGTDPEPVDATRGLRDYADDLAATIEALGLAAVHLVGWSMGGGVVLQYLADRPAAHQVASLTLVDPVSPFGFGGTRGLDGTLCDPSGAGSGGGTANRDFIARLAAGDRGGASPLSPRQVLLAHYVKPPHVPEHLDIFVESMLSTRLGDDHYPAPRAPWRPGRASRPATAACSTPWRPPTSGSATCPGCAQAAGPVAARRGRRHRLRHLAVRPGLPGLDRRGAGLAGEQAWPPQPMVAQTRAVLDGYAGPAAATARSSSRTPATARTWTSPTSSWPR